MTNPNLRLRQMRPEDLPDVDLVQHSCFISELIEQISLFEEMLVHYPEGNFVVEIDERVIAYHIAHPATEGRNDYEKGSWNITGNEGAMYIHDMAVHLDYRGQGISNILFDRLVTFAKMNGFQKLIGIAVQGAETYWQKLGFKMVQPYLYNGEPGTFMMKEL